MAKTKNLKKSRRNSVPASYLIQFIDDEPILIPGTGSVAVRGQFLDIGPGKLGVNFPYRSPEEQVEHYKQQKYVLVAAYDEEENEIDHPDIERTADGGHAFIDAEDAAQEPALQNRGTNVVGGNENQEVTSSKKKTKSRSSSKGASKKKKTTKKSSGKSKKSSKSTE